MGMLGARPKGRGAASEQSSTLSADRLSQLMTFVERAAAPPPTYVVPDLPPPLICPPRSVEAAATPVPASAPVTATVDPGAAVTFPDPILVEPAPVAGRRRRLLPRSA